MNNDPQIKITVTANGPYIVTGRVPLAAELIILSSSGRVDR